MYDCWISSTDTDTVEPSNLYTEWCRGLSYTLITRHGAVVLPPCLSLSRAPHPGRRAGIVQAPGHTPLNLLNYAILYYTKTASNSSCNRETLPPHENLLGEQPWRRLHGCCTFVEYNSLLWAVSVRHVWNSAHLSTVHQRPALGRCQPVCVCSREAQFTRAAGPVQTSASYLCQQCDKGLILLLN